MHGDGTRTATTTASPGARCLDLTRLISRVDRGPDTGVDRVERAYLRRLLVDPVPLYALVRSSLGYILLGPDGVAAIAARLDGVTPWGKTDMLGLLARKAPLARRRAHADLRRHAIGRCRTGKLAGLLRRHIPPRCTYLNTGHSNLREEVFDAWGSVPGATRAVLIHDMIPLDFPQYQRPGTPEKFEHRMRQVSRGADLVIYNSEVSQRDGARWFARFGRVPPGVVAHLGIDLPDIDTARIPQDLPLDRPYFVTLGTIEPRKNHAVLLDVWDQLAQELDKAHLPRLFIIGRRGWENHDVFSRLDSSPLTGDTIIERSDIGDAALAAILNGAQALLCPSHIEGFGLPPAEAASLGVPVVCTDLQVYREFLANIPVYLESGDVYSWKQSVKLLTNQKRAVDKHDPTSNWTGLPTWTGHFDVVLNGI